MILLMLLAFARPHQVQHTPRTSPPRVISGSPTRPSPLSNVTSSSSTSPRVRDNRIACCQFSARVGDLVPWIKGPCDCRRWRNRQSHSVRVDSNSSSTEAADHSVATRSSIALLECHGSGPRSATSQRRSEGESLTECLASRTKSQSAGTRCACSCAPVSTRVPGPAPPGGAGSRAPAPGGCPGGDGPPRALLRFIDSGVLGNYLPRVGVDSGNWGRTQPNPISNRPPVA